METTFSASVLVDIGLGFIFHTCTCIMVSTMNAQCDVILTHISLYQSYLYIKIHFLSVNHSRGFFKVHDCLQRKMFRERCSAFVGKFVNFV